jgi:hypothetical protein
MFDALLPPWDQRGTDQVAGECVCSGCNRHMGFESLKVLHFAAGSKEAIFRCSACGSETTQAINMR